MKCIIRNSAICMRCQDEVVSRHRHDFRSCRCGAMFVDGGKEYLRRGGDLTYIMDTSLHGWVDLPGTRR